MSLNYKTYQEKIKDDVGRLLSDMGCQPILFIGAGLSRRYAMLPSWDELLDHLAKEGYPKIKPINYYRQHHNQCNPQIGSALAQEYALLAWDESMANRFPDNLYKSPNSDIFIKHTICEYLLSKIEDSNFLENQYKDEIERIQSINPHAIITTNYDSMIELIFPYYKPIIGQKIIRDSLTTYGEIFKYMVV